MAQERSISGTVEKCYDFLLAHNCCVIRFSLNQVFGVAKADQPSCSSLESIEHFCSSTATLSVARTKLKFRHHSKSSASFLKIRMSTPPPSPFSFPQFPSLYRFAQRRPMLTFFTHSPSNSGTTREHTVFGLPCSQKSSKSRPSPIEALQKQIQRTF